MKKILLVIAVFLTLEGYSQITLDIQNSLSAFSVIHLSSTETKYFDNDQWSMNHQNQFSLYNLDGSLYKTIQMPAKPDTAAFFYTLFYISRTLFDNDNTNLEYLVAYEWGSSGGIPTHLNVKIIREDGTILLDEDNASTNYWPPLIYNTEDGTKIMLFYYQDSTSFYYQTKIFNLPGTLLAVSKDQLNPAGNFPIVYPNPNNGTFSINFQSDNSIEKNIEVLNSEGRLINTYRTKSNAIKINQPELPEGLYLLNTHSSTGFSTSKMIIQK